MTRYAIAGLALSIIADVTLLANGCGPAPGAGERTLTLGAYTAPREVYAELVPQFASAWKQKTGESLKVEQSYLGSGAQARAIVGGFEADVAALSLQPDIDTLVKADLAHGEAKVVSRSIVVIGVRPGNPKHIKDFSDLTRDDVDVLTPDVKMSGGAMWNVLALNAAGGEQLVTKVLARVKVFDKGARESMLTFESGAGDAIITYENEIEEAKRANKPIEEVVPVTTVLIENPAIVVDGYAAKHKTGDVAVAFLDFLQSAEAQKVFAAHGYRAPGSSSSPASPASARVVTIADLGGWAKARAELFDTGALYDRALAKAKAK